MPKSRALSWRAARTYQPCVLAFLNELKMWFTGLNTESGGTYAIGYASAKGRPPRPVGGKWVPIDKFELLGPWIGIASFITVTESRLSVLNRAKSNETKLPSFLVVCFLNLLFSRLRIEFCRGFLLVGPRFSRNSSCANSQQPNCTRA